MEKDNTKKDEIALIKTVMTIIIVLYHSMLFFGGNWFTVYEPVYKNKVIYEIARWFNSFQTQTFTMASGFLFFYLLIERGHYVNKKEAIKKRFKRLIIPLFSTAIFWVIPIYIIFFGFNFIEIKNKYILLKSPNQLWFLLMLFGVFVIFELINKKIRINRKNLVLIYIISTCSSLCLKYFNIDYFQATKITQYILYFYLGGIIYKFGKKINKKQIIIMIIIVIMLYPFNIIEELQNNTITKIIISFLNPLISISEVTIIYCIFKRVALKKKKDIFILNTIEKNGFGIYLFHQQIIYFTILAFNGKVYPIVQVAISFIIALSLSLLISIILKKNRITQKMFAL